MEFTGERYLASIRSAQISYEHWHRYLFASAFVKNKTVLDVASGEGYGTALLARHASKVVGVDYSHAAVKWAKNTYPAENCTFIAALCTDIPIEGESVFDVVVSFETIEHIDGDDQKLFLKEIKRLMKPDGTLIISTPNKKFYSERDNYKNEFHLKEFYREEFEGFLKTYFKHVELGGQKIYTSSWIWPFKKNTSQFQDQNIELGENGFTPTEGEKEDLYDIAVCSDSEDVPFFHSGLTDISQQIKTEQEEYIKEVVRQKDFIVHEKEKEIQEKDNQIHEKDAQAEKFQELIRENESKIAQAHKIIQENECKIQESGTVIQEKENRIQEDLTIIREKDNFIQSEYELIQEKTQIIQERDRIIMEKDKDIAQLKSSFSWKITKPLRVADAFLRRLYKQFGRIITIQRNIRLISKSGLFDKDYYLTQNPDFKYAKIFPIMHYLLFGGFEGRNPSPGFHSGFYLDKYKEVSKCGINPLVHYILHGEKEGRAPTAYIGVFDAITKEDYLLQKQGDFYGFIKSGMIIQFPETKPEVSIVLVLYNAVELSYACLQSIVQYADVPYEVIIIDNNSTDKTPLLLDKIKGAKIIRNKDNLHFLKGCNQALQSVKGKYMVFLNNDAVLMDGTLKAAYGSIAGNNKCGAVGGKIVLADGTLQEAGSIIWNDGSCLGYGRGDMPDKPEYNFSRVVDYCSGAFLMTRTELFRQHSGFDISFEPAYYEETDYCLWLQEQGHEVVYEPKAVIRHYEFGSGVKESAVMQQQKNQKLFYEKHKHQLINHFIPDANNIKFARFAASERNMKKLLYIDDRVPHAALGSGFPRSNTIVRCIQELGYKVTIIPLNFPQENWISAYNDIDPFTEVMMGCGLANFSEFIQSRKDYYDFIWISRPHNMKALKTEIAAYAKDSMIIYDAEAIFADREISKKIFEGEAVDENLKQAEIQKELCISDLANVVTSVSVADAERFKEYGKPDVRVLGHVLSVEEPESTFEERSGLLFIGNLDYDDTPNADSVLWFVNEILPLVTSKLPGIELSIVGSCNSKAVSSLNVGGVHIHGRVDDILEFYTKSRVFIAPTRYAAGIPYKIHEAAAYGLPVVATERLTQQLGWNHNLQLLSAKAEKEDFAEKVIELYCNKSTWESVRRNALKEIKDTMSNDAYKQKISEILTGK